MRVARNSLATDKPVALEFPIELEFTGVGFCGRKKTGEPLEKTSVQGREPKTNSTWVQESSPGLIGGKRVLSPLRYPALVKDEANL